MSDAPRSRNSLLCWAGARSSGGGRASISTALYERTYCLLMTYALVGKPLLPIVDNTDFGVACPVAKFGK